MASTTNKPFHTYENVGYDDQTNNHYVPPPLSTTTNSVTTAVSTNSIGTTVSKTAIESPFPDPIHGKLTLYIFVLSQISQLTN